MSSLRLPMNKTDTTFKLHSSMKMVDNLLSQRRIFYLMSEKIRKTFLPILPKQQDELQINLFLLAKPYIQVNEYKTLK